MQDARVPRCYQSLFLVSLVCVCVIVGLFTTGNVVVPCIERVSWY